MISLENTGERLLPEVSSITRIEHLHRYYIACELCENKDVIDIASGEGYGSNLLANVAKSVTGIDIADEAVKHANEKYRKNNLKYIQSSADNINLRNDQADVIVSFETIEHHDKHDQMMLEIKRVLKSEGILIMSSPDKLNYSDRKRYQNPYHVKELYENEFKDLIMKYFKYSKFIKQRAGLLSLCIPENKEIEFTAYKSNLNSKSIDESFGPEYWITIASDIPIPIVKFAPFILEDEIFLKLKEEKEYYCKLIESYKTSRSYKMGNFAINLITLKWNRFLK